MRLMLCACVWPVFIISVLVWALFAKSKYTGSCDGPDLHLLFKLH